MKPTGFLDKLLKRKQEPAAATQEPAAEFGAHPGFRLWPSLAQVPRAPCWACSALAHPGPPLMPTTACAKQFQGSSAALRTAVWGALTWGTCNAQGKHDILAYHLCRVLLYDDSNYPAWVVLVPQVPNVTVSAAPRKPFHKQRITSAWLVDSS